MAPSQEEADRVPIHDPLLTWNDRRADWDRTLDANRVLRATGRLVRLAFMGGIDMGAMAHPYPEAIEHEISARAPVAKKDGGYTYHSDHSVPSNVSFQQYCHTIDLVRKYGSCRTRRRGALWICGQRRAATTKANIQ